MAGRETYRFPWSSYPGARISFLLASGIVSASFFSSSLQMLHFTVALVIILWALTEWTAGKEVNMRAVLVSITVYLIIIPLFGFVRSAHQQEHVRLQAEQAAYLSLHAWQEVQMEGRIKDRMQTPAGRPAFDMQVERTVLQSGVWSRPFLVRLYGGEALGDISGLNPGNRARVTVRLHELYGPVNPGRFDYREFLHSRGIFTHGTILSVYRMEALDGRVSWETMRTVAHRRIDLLFGESAAPLAKALLMGHRQGLASEDQQLYARAGLSHIMAVSGLHVGFIVAPLWFLIPWLWQWRYGGWAGYILLTLLLFAYAGLTGFSVSVSRASLMAWLLSAGKLMKKMSTGINLVGVSAFILLALDPSQLFDIGFQLSYGAVIIILLLMPHLQMQIPTDIRHSIKGRLLSILMISVLVQLGLLPILGWYFGEFSIIGPLANALVVPLLSVTVPFSLLNMLLAGAMPELALLLNTPNRYVMTWIRHVAELLGGWSGSWIEVSLSSPFVFGLWILLAATFAAIRIPALRFRYVILLLLALSVWTLTVVLDKTRPTEMKVVVLDVGQGDAVHIHTPGGRHILIDTGRWSPLGNSGESVLVPYLESEGIDYLDAVILTHPHADHIGGTSVLLGSIEIGALYHCGTKYDSMVFRTYRDLARRKGVLMNRVEKGDMIDIDPSIRLFVLGPGKRLNGTGVNNASVLLKAVYNRSSFLFMGDAERGQEERVMRVYGDFLESDFLKVAHHGSRTSSHNEFLAYATPVKAAVSLSLTNHFSHPHPEAVERIRRYADDIFFTSLEGALTFRTDGTGAPRVDVRN